LDYTLPGRRLTTETPGNVQSGTATPPEMPYDDDDEIQQQQCDLFDKK